MNRLRAWWIRNITGGTHSHPEGYFLPETCEGCQIEREARL